MKKIIIALVGLIISLIFYSCGEITDIGDVQKFPIYPPIPEPASTLVKPDSTYWLIVEGYPDKYVPTNTLGFPWGKKMKFVRNNIIIDTLSEFPVVSIDIQLESTFPDLSLPDRIDRAASFRIKLDSIELKGGMLSTEERNESNWFEIFMKTIKDQKVYYLNQDELNVDWMFAVTSPGIISGYFFVMIPNKHGFQTQFLSITFDLYYQNKKVKN
ncbi:MAG: hypothetical protein V1779_02635 [bacterium]